VANPTLSALRTATRQKLGEATARAWTDTELTAWLNEAVREVCRRTLCYEKRASITVNAGDYEKSLATIDDLIMVDRVDVVPTGSQVSYPLQYRDLHSMDSIWNVSRQTSRGTPEFYALWGVTPSLTMFLFPVPAQGYTVNFNYYGYAPTLAADSDVLSLPIGWHDLVADYATYLAYLRDSDSRWQQFLASFNDGLLRLIEVNNRRGASGGFIDNVSTWGW